MIAAAIVCAAVISQAASVEWSMYNFDPISNPDSGDFNGTVTLACAELGWSDTATVSDGYFDAVFTIESELDASYDFTITASYVDGAGKEWSYAGIGSGSSDNFGSGGAGFDPGTWTAVPEPTSGLLLLLGVAGLALKRKRA